MCPDTLSGRSLPGSVPRAAVDPPRFDRPVAPSGYAWWYLDALSDDGSDALTVIAFVGSVFSPWYARARRHGMANPMDHCALNVALYRPRGRVWSFTERQRQKVCRDEAHFQIGPSSVAWNKDALEIRIDEVAAPLPRRMRGRIRLTPENLNSRAFILDSQGMHRWRPIAIDARVDVDLDEPSMRWSGRGYLDTNDGDRPLEADFIRWDWSRGSAAGRGAILYDAVRRDGTRHGFALEAGSDGQFRPGTMPKAVALPSTLWGVTRGTHADSGPTPKIARTLEDTPFYARSLLSTHLLGTPMIAMHESLDLDRFRSRWVQLLLPFRAPRALGWRP